MSRPPWLRRRSRRRSRTPGATIPDAAEVEARRVLKAEIVAARERNQHVQVAPDPVFLAAYTDASLDKRSAGFALWARDSRRRVLAAGPCPSWIGRDTNLAELCGVTASVEVCLAHLDAASAHILVVKSDCQTVCQWFGWKAEDGRPGALPERVWALSLIRDAQARTEAAGLKLVVTWVKGHQAPISTRGYLNDRVDRMAREARLRRAWSLWSVETQGQAPPRQRREPDLAYPFDAAVRHHLCRPLH